MQQYQNATVTERSRQQKEQMTSPKASVTGVTGGVSQSGMSRGHAKGEFEPVDILLLSDPAGALSFRASHGHDLFSDFQRIAR